MRIKNLLIFLSLSCALLAQPKAGYYNAEVGKSQAALKTSLSSIISSGYKDVGYDGLYNIYPTSDKTASGNVWDMYSTCTWTHGQKKCGNYKNVCDCYNREHSVPQSWFSSRSPMVSDAFHVYPTDGKVNGQRSNYPFGECSNGTTLAGGKGRLGNSTFPGYTGTVFEPADEYKGDFARTYFYFVTRYESQISGFSGASFSSNTYPSLSTWSQALFLKWHRQDPVSQKEIDRNNAIEVYQKNRNPYIDHPELVEFVWGTRKGEAWNLTSDVENPTTNAEFKIGPIPAKDFITIETNLSSFDYAIYNHVGQCVAMQTVVAKKIIDISHIDNGVYILQIYYGNKKYTNKIIISK